MKNAILGLCFALTMGVLQVFANGGVPLWTNLYNGPLGRDDVATAIAVEANGNVFVTGYSAMSNIFPFDYGWVTIKYSSAGVPLWTNRFNGTENADDYPYAAVVDKNGNAFVTGASSHALPGSGYDFVTLAYSSTGTPLWTNRYDGPGGDSDVAHAIAVDAQGNVLVTGDAEGNGVGLDYTTIKHSNAGIPLWTNRYNGTGNGLDRAQAMAVDANGNVFVTGESYGSGTDYDFATLAYSAAGVPLWINRYAGPGTATAGAVALAVDSRGGVLVTGTSAEGDVGFRFVTIKYSGAGVPLWTNYYQGRDFDALGGPAAIVVDGNDDVIVTGRSQDSQGEDDYTTIKYSSAGEALWTNRYDGPAHGNDHARGTAVDKGGNVFVTGYSDNDINGNSSDYATVAYSSAGTLLWTARYHGAGDSEDYASAIAVDGSGNVFVTGGSRGANGAFDYATIKYSSSLPTVRLESQLISNQLVLSWTNASFGLQSAPAVSGPFTNIPGATSPYTNPISGAQQLFRLISN